MNSSDDDNDFEDDTLCKYGSALPQFEADEIPSKKPIQVEDMVVKDENGRRRFHGAFTGGFSAGYWNTVGSKEGFQPQEFKSSRFEKASFKSFKPTDFMDDEDFGEFGIAPQKIQTKEDFGSSSSGTKRKREKPSDGPIPGEPVLGNLLKPTRDKAAVRILKSMGWRDNQGIGSRMTYQEKKRAKERNLREMYMIDEQNKADSDEDFSDDEITFAPDDFDPYIMNVKDNTFGLGYSGLKPTTTSQKGHVNFFKTFVGRNDKKFTIGGSAFGVGALEEEDDDIYAVDDMSNYDRTLEGEVDKGRKKATKTFDASLLEGFAKATINDCQVRVYSVDVPRNFTPRNWLQRRSRFEPMDRGKAEVIEAQNRHRKLGLGRHDLKPEERGSLINEKTEEVKKKEEETAKAKKEESAKKISDLLSSKQFVSENNQTFKPFVLNPEKQERYEKFLALKTSDEKVIEKLLNDIQPLGMSSFDREMEKKEFMQAKRMYQPLDSLMANRFIKEVDARKENEVIKKIENGKEIVVIQRTTSMWKPHKNLCKRFNVPEPYGGMMFDEEEEKKRKKQSSSLFDFIGVPLNTKSNFVAPQVIPRKLTEDTTRKDEESERRKKFLAAVEKEKHFMGVGTARATAKDFFDEGDKGKKSETPSQILRKEPESELEKKAIESIDKKPEEKKDLFKAIFCDSDDEDSEEQPPALQPSTSESSSHLSEQQKSKFIESFLNTKPASEINVLRNKSPPRGIFKGIFDLASTSKKIEESQVSAENEDENFYGPKPPTTLLPSIPAPHSISSNSSSSDESDLDEKLLKKLKKVKRDKSSERWVEKDKVKKAKKEKKSKKKKHRKEHKKHKSKK